MITCSDISEELAASMFRMNELVWTEDEKTLHLKSEDIQDISCECSAVYKGQTSYSIETRIKEHCCHYA